MSNHEAVICPVVLGLRRRWRLCALPATHVRTQDGVPHSVCAFHAAYAGRLPFHLCDLMPCRNQRGGSE